MIALAGFSSYESVNGMGEYESVGAIPMMNTRGYGADDSGGASAVTGAVAFAGALGGAIYGYQKWPAHPYWGAFFGWIMGGAAGRLVGYVATKS